jgi:hypothetical protein
MPDAAQELMALRKRAADLDQRRQGQIGRQVASITRLAEAAQASDPAGVAREIERLSEELALADARLEAVRQYAEREHDPATRIDLLRLIGAQ